MSGQKIETDFIILEVVNGIIYCTYKPKVISFEVAKQVVQLRSEFSKEKDLPMLVMEMGVAKMDKDARDYLSSEEGTKGLSAGAIVTNSTFQATLANFFLKVTNPKMPARLFTNKDQALEWLAQFK